MKYVERWNVVKMLKKIILLKKYSFYI